MHGIRVIEILTGARPITAVATAIIGLVATAPDADAAAFPLNTPVLVTDVRAALADAGVQGTLAGSLAAIADQCSPIVIVVRVAPGADAATTELALVGDAGGYTGVHALLAAEAQLGVRPRILGCPGLDTQAVTAALVSVAKKLRGMVYASCAGADTVAEATDYRDEFADRELMLIYPNFSGGFAGSAVARALGLRARIDSEMGWHKTLSNVAVAGVSGLSAPIFFDLQSDATDAGLLNAAPVTTLVRMNGHRYWGNRTCSDEPLFAFESAVRTSQALADEISAGLAWAVDKPLNAGLVRDVLETINARFRSLQAQGRIVGAVAYFDPAQNAREDLAAGRLAIDYEFTPCAPAEQITLNQRITDRFYGTLGAQL
jgi:hypothetical protein